MPAKRLGGESGYTLIEVMVSIVIMTLAILPMMAMFDTGLNSATTGSNYDTSRALANLKLEQAKNMSFDSLEGNFPEPAGTPTTYNGSGFYQSAWKTEPGADFVAFQYRVEKQYMAQPSTAPASASADFSTSSTPTSLIRVTVTVRWANGNEYTTYGLVTR
jgi:prepilin-type N-terminal cleavage/methylation domain-containing protein